VVDGGAAAAAAAALGQESKTDGNQPITREMVNSI
jgi:hypothetical protein